MFCRERGAWNQRRKFKLSLPKYNRNSAQKRVAEPKIILKQSRR